MESHHTDGLQDPCNQNISEPDPDDSEGDEFMVLEPHAESSSSQVDVKMDSHHIEVPLPASENDIYEQVNPNNSGVSPTKPSLSEDILRNVTIQEPELVDSGEEPSTAIQDQRDSENPTNQEFPVHVNGAPGEPHENDYHDEEMQIEPVSGESTARSQTAEADPDDLELQIIQDPVTIFCGRLQSAIQSLKYEITPSGTGRVLQTLVKIIR